MSYTQATALIRQAERQMAGGSQSTAAVVFPQLSVVPKFPPSLPAPLLTGAGR